MPTKTNEQALEAAIQEKLSGLTLEEIKEKDPAANVAEESELGLLKEGLDLYDAITRSKKAPNTSICIWS